MTQQEAIDMLEEIFGHELNMNCTGTTCTEDECMICSVRDCPHNEPLHYHHDGCPACYQEEN